MIHALFRGVIGAMAMTGLRLFASHAGVIREAPPNRLARKQAHGLLKLAPRGRRPAVVELIHWTMGGVFGAGYGLLPESIRQRSWSGLLYGFSVWMVFDIVIAPVLGLTQRNWPKGRERAVFMVDHLMFGLVLSELRSQPRE
jgi:uncharacterized membrane protein YagU involved in acid resistance